jgi:uncharacterized protein YbjT (DUF2867 family)
LKNLLITGATGNVGRAVIRHLQKKEGSFKILAGLRNIQKLPFKDERNVEPIHFDFGDRDSITNALRQAEILFLLRPPQLADVKQYFEPVISIAREESIEHIVFLSVQGAENNSLIPHYKIEQLIIDSSLPYTFLRPAYFMQNFTTTLREDIIKKKEVFLPAGKAKFTLVDLQDVGRTGAQVLLHPEQHSNKAYALTNQEQLTFGQMTSQLNEELGIDIRFRSPNLLHFYWRKRKEGVTHMLILVMIMLHYLPRFQKAPPTTPWVEKITGQKPQTFKGFVLNNLSSFQYD